MSEGVGEEVPPEARRKALKYAEVGLRQVWNGMPGFDTLGDEFVTTAMVQAFRNAAAALAEVRRHHDIAYATQSLERSKANIEEQAKLIARLQEMGP